MILSRPTRVLVTRSAHQASELATHLQALGVEPVTIPVIELVEPSSYGVLDSALSHLSSFDWLLFTSANAVEAFARRLEANNGHARQSLLTNIENFLASEPLVEASSCEVLVPSATPRIAAIGGATARALQQIGLQADLVPEQAVAESLTAALLPHANRSDGSPGRFLLVRAEEAREHLPEALCAAGAEVVIAPAYRTIIPEQSVQAVRELFRELSTWPDAITFTSSSTARNTFALLTAAGVFLRECVDSQRLVLASIGPITSQTLRELGYEPDVESATATVQALAESLVKHLNATDSA